MKSTTPAKIKKNGHEQPAKRSGNPFELLHRQMNELFEGFMGDSTPAWPRMEDWSRMSPKFDITESANGYHMEAELPGMDEKSVEVKIDGDTLTIRGEKTEESEKKGREYLLSERSYGSFQRSFTIPEGVEVDKVRAVFKKGVLDICLPKSEKAKKQAKKIEVAGK